MTGENQESHDVSVPKWLLDQLGVPALVPGTPVEACGRSFLLDAGVVRVDGAASDAQTQTADVFGFKWHQRETFESAQAESAMKSWLIERYGDVERASWWDDHGERPLLLDAGCGAGRSAVLLFGDRLRTTRYLGADISEAVDAARDRFAREDLEGGYLQCDLLHLPLAPGSVDVIFSEGVLHHTDSTREALLSLARLLRAGGRILFYVYRRKGPLREFADDYIRGQLQELSPEEAWEAMKPLTRLGQALGELDVTVDVPDDVRLLEIPAGHVSVQRLWYWHVCKAFYDPTLDLEELNHINYDWYAPRNAHRQTPEDVRAWCAEAGLEIERESVEEAGITIVARAGSQRSGSP